MEVFEEYYNQSWKFLKNILVSTYSYETKASLQCNHLTYKERCPNCNKETYLEVNGSHESTQI